MRYRAFRTKKDNRFYFQFLSEGDQVLLRSQAYENKEDCFNGIRSVITNAGNADRYESKEENDQYFFILKAANSQEIGRSINYESSQALTSAIDHFRTEAPNAKSKSTDTQEAETSKSASAPTTESSPEKPYEEGARGADDYKPLAFYEARAKDTQDGFARFNENEEDWFTYNLGGEVVLISEGYSSENSRDKGIESVSKNMVNESRYQRQVHPNGKHYFNLRAGNNQEIATSRWFDSEAEMNKVIGMLTRGKTGTWRDDRIYKDYRPLAFYQEHISGEEFGYDSFTDEDKYYFSVNYEGDPVLISEDYTSEAGRDNGIDSIKKNVKNEKRYEREQHPNGKYYFNLLAGNKQEIATSRWFDSEKEMEKAINWLQSTGGTRRRKKPKREKKASKRRYIQQSQPYPCSDITYDTFQSGGNDKFYFVFKNKEDKVLLINGHASGLATTEALDKAIDAVKQFAREEKNYERRETKNGKHYFVIKNKEGKTVARSSLFYVEKDDMEANIKLLACGLVPGATKTAAAAPGTSGAIVDDYLPCEAYAGATGFHKFFNQEKKEYYFAYNRENGRTLLRSEGYTTEAARDNGIASVIKNAPNAERWSTETALNGEYHYFRLKAGNNQEIARSCFYDSADEMMAAFSWVKGSNSPIGAGSQEVDGQRLSAAALAARAASSTKAAETPPKAIQDDYMPCEAYAQEKGGFHKFFNEDRKEHYFSYNHTDGKTLLRSEGYTTEAARDNGMESVTKNAPLEERWVTGDILNGRHHYYALRAGNNQEIARSCYYDDRAAMMADLALIQGEESPIGIGAAMVGGTMMSFAALSRQKAKEEAAAAKAAAELEAKRKAEEDEKKAAAAAAAKAAAEAEAKRKAEEAEKKKAAAAAAALAAKKKAEEEAAAAKAAAEADAKRNAEEEEKKKAAAAAAAALAAKKKAEEEAARKAAAEAEAKRKAEEEEKKKAAAAAAAAAGMGAAAASSGAGGGGGQYSETNQYVDKSNDDGGGFPWWAWLLLLLALLALLWFFRGCFGCGPDTPPPVVPPVDSTAIDSSELVPPEPMGPDGDAMGFATGTVPYAMANHLSDALSGFPVLFELDKVTFRRNRARIDSDGRAELEKIIQVLKQYPDAKIDIYGYVGDNERSAYRGSKELLLDDVRARAIYDYFMSKGIDENRMNFTGNGGSSTTQAAIRLRSRD